MEWGGNVYGQDLSPNMGKCTLYPINYVSGFVKFRCGDVNV